MKHTISVLVKNEPGILSCVCDLFSTRGFNIESLTVAATIDPVFSRITIVTSGDDVVIEQICKQLNRLINTIKVVELPKSADKCIDRELILCKVTAKDEARNEILRIAEIFGAKIVDVSTETYTVEFSGDVRQVSTIIALLKPLGVKELVRSGMVAITRENQFINLNK
ncbi:MAG: acetolactate synthase small subunit [Candidatus Gastranaerophilales bacterium]|nr:acetolactate synthase small subunit [Candidatus Gastranaerophilales bacterium]